MGPSLRKTPKTGNFTLCGIIGMSPSIPAYLPTIDWCPELCCYAARCPDLFPGALHGDEPHQLLDEILTAIAEATDGARQDGPMQLAA